MDDHARTLMTRRMPTPLYHRLYVLMRDKIVNGEYRVGDLLPTEQDLLNQFGVSRITAKRALDDLAAEGLVERRRGMGSRVISRPALKPLSMPLGGLLDSLEILADNTAVHALDQRDEAATPAIAERLGVAPGAPVFRLTRRRTRHEAGHQHGPFALLTSHTLEPAAGALRPMDLDRESRLKRFRDAGIVIAEARQTLTASLADARSAPALEVEVGSALLQLDRTLFDGEGRAFDHLTALYRPDRYQYLMDLTIDEDGAMRPPVTSGPMVLSVDG